MLLKEIKPSSHVQVTTKTCAVAPHMSPIMGHLPHLQSSTNSEKRLRGIHYLIAVNTSSHAFDVFVSQWNNQRDNGSHTIGEYFLLMLTYRSSYICFVMHTVDTPRQTYPISPNISSCIYAHTYAWTATHMHMDTQI